jgi:serine/threonine protein kinase
LKPSNIFFSTSTGEIKIGDFGLARFDVKDKSSKVGEKELSNNQFNLLLSKNIEPEYTTNIGTYF